MNTLNTNSKEKPSISVNSPRKWNLLNNVVPTREILSKPSITLRVSRLGYQHLEKDCSLTNVKLDIVSCIVSIFFPVFIYMILKHIFTFPKKKSREQIVNPELSTIVSTAQSEYTKMSKVLKEYIFESSSEFRRFNDIMTGFSYILRTTDPKLFKKIRIRDVHAESKVLHFYSKEKLDKLYVAVQFYINILYLAERSLKWYNTIDVDSEVGFLRPYKKEIQKFDPKLLKFIKKKLHNLSVKGHLKTFLEKRIIFLQERIDILDASNLCNLYLLTLSSVERKHNINISEVKRNLYQLEKSLKLLIPELYNLYK